ncbi:hypothetical protein F5Y15DRAFT_416885 [Xylariaceae sp. FL0016]|nr:hypothetical protein F5Y15DRAFT_416885 [Xylariaceae sp. FL0016]
MQFKNLLSAAIPLFAAVAPVMAGDCYPGGMKFEDIADETQTTEAMWTICDHLNGVYENQHGHKNAKVGRDCYDVNEHSLEATVQYIFDPSVETGNLTLIECFEELQWIRGACDKGGKFKSASSFFFRFDPQDEPCQ